METVYGIQGRKGFVEEVRLGFQCELGRTEQRTESKGGPPSESKGTGKGSSIPRKDTLTCGSLRPCKESGQPELQQESEHALLDTP